MLFGFSDGVGFTVCGPRRTVSSCRDQSEDLCCSPVGSGMRDPGGPIRSRCRPPVGGSAWTARDPRGEAARRSAVRGARGESVRKGGTCFGGSTALCHFLRRVAGESVASLHFGPQYRFQRAMLLLAAKQTDPGPVCPAAILGGFAAWPAWVPAFSYWPTRLDWQWQPRGWSQCHPG